MFKNFLSSLVLNAIAILIAFIMFYIHIRNILYKVVIAITDFGDYVLYPLSTFLLIVTILFSILIMSINTAEYIIELSK